MCSRSTTIAAALLTAVTLNTIATPNSETVSSTSPFIGQNPITLEGGGLLVQKEPKPSQSLQKKKKTKQHPQQHQHQQYQHQITNQNNPTQPKHLPHNPDKLNHAKQKPHTHAQTLTADITTAELACCRRGVTRSMIPSASRPSAGLYLASESRMNTWRERRTRAHGDSGRVSRGSSRGWDGGIASRCFPVLKVSTTRRVSKNKKLNG